MMKKQILLLSLLLLGFISNAQYNTVEKIRAYYTEVNQDINEAIKTKTGEYCNEVMVNAYKSSWPAVGNYQKKISMWYSDAPEASEEEKPVKLLDKVNVIAESAGNKYTEEYLFADGELIFYCFFDFYHYNGIVQKDEHRLYFNKGKVLKYDLKAGGHNEYPRDKADIPAEAIGHAKLIQQLFLSSCD